EPGFVVQGGGFKVASAPNNFSVTTTTASPQNEPGISNIRGTVAMAKTAGNPNSATNQFFVNLGNNNSSDPESLDNQNGGFTVFARVATPGLVVADAIAALPRGNYSVKLGTTATTLSDFPMDEASAPSTIDVTKVVKVNSATPVGVLSYSVSQTNSSVVSASISGNSLAITALAGGQSTVTVQATDLDGNVTSQSFTVTVNQTAGFANGPATNSALVGTAYAFSYSATGYPAPTYQVTAGALPVGLLLGSDGAISGTPTTPGVFSGTVTASNGIGTPVTQDFSITVNQVPTFLSGAPPSAPLVNVPYSFTFTASGFPAPTFALTQGQLPTGLALATGGALTGTPTATGVFTGTVTSSNGVGTPATQDFSISVNQVPVISNGPAPSIGLVGVPFVFSYSASGFPVPTFTVTAGALPSGLLLTSGGTITGTPTTPGVYTGTIASSNGIGTAATQNFSVTVSQRASQWATQQGLSGAAAASTANPDGDAFTNLQEFVLLTNPKSAEASPLIATAANARGSITFRVRKFMDGVTVAVEASGSLASDSWTSIWSSTSGFTGANVTSQDNGDHYLVTVTDTQNFSTNQPRFLRVAISEQ
ncbi:MAG: putative Ig domain-containing protein, partial [Roseimicrobium sp.]